MVEYSYKSTSSSLKRQLEQKGLFKLEAYFIETIRSVTVGDSEAPGNRYM